MSWLLGLDFLVKWEELLRKQDKNLKRQSNSSDPLNKQKDLKKEKMKSMFIPELKKLNIYVCTGGTITNMFNY